MFWQHLLALKHALDYLLLHQVVMLRSVGDLLRYIDENHLAGEFTGTVEYCQSDWIVLRTVHNPGVIPTVQNLTNNTKKDRILTDQC